MTYWEPDLDETDWDYGEQHIPTRGILCTHTHWLRITKNGNALLCVHCKHTTPLPKTWHRNRKTHLELQPPLTSRNPRNTRIIQ